MASDSTIFSRLVHVSIGPLPETNGFFFFFFYASCTVFSSGIAGCAPVAGINGDCTPSIPFCGRSLRSPRETTVTQQINVPGCAVSLAAKSSQEQQKYHLHFPGRIVAALLRLWQGIQLERDGSFTTADHSGRDHAAPLLLASSCLRTRQRNCNRLTDDLADQPPGD